MPPDFSATVPEHPSFPAWGYDAKFVSTSDRLLRQSKYAVDCFTRDLAIRRRRQKSPPPATTPPPADPPDDPVPDLPDVLFTTTSSKPPRIRRNKYGIPDVRHLGGLVTPERFISIAPCCFQTRTPRDVRLLTSSDIRDEPDLFTICLDTGCTIAISFSKADFIHEPVRGNFGKMKTVQGTVEIAGFGIVEWTVVDTQGYKRILRMPAYYIPSAEQRLMSPQAFARYNSWGNPEESCFSGNDQHMWLLLPNPEHVYSKLHIPFSAKDCIPSLQTHFYMEHPRPACMHWDR